MLTKFAIKVKKDTSDWGDEDWENLDPEKPWRVGRWVDDVDTESTFLISGKEFDTSSSEMEQNIGDFIDDSDGLDSERSGGSLGVPTSEEEFERKRSEIEEDILRDEGRFENRWGGRESSSNQDVQDSSGISELGVVGGVGGLTTGGILGHELTRKRRHQQGREDEKYTLGDYATTTGTALAGGALGAYGGSKLSKMGSDLKKVAQIERPPRGQEGQRRREDPSALEVADEVASPVVDALALGGRQAMRGAGGATAGYAVGHHVGGKIDESLPFVDDPASDTLSTGGALVGGYKGVTQGDQSAVDRAMGTMQSAMGGAGAGLALSEYVGGGEQGDIAAGTTGALGAAVLDYLASERLK